MTRTWNASNVITRRARDMSIGIQNIPSNQEAIDRIDANLPEHDGSSSVLTSCEKIDSFLANACSKLEFETALKSGKSSSAPGLYGITWDLLRHLPNCIP